MGSIWIQLVWEKFQLLLVLYPENGEKTPCWSSSRSFSSDNCGLPGFSPLSWLTTNILRRFQGVQTCSPSTFPAHPRLFEGAQALVLRAPSANSSRDGCGKSHGVSKVFKWKNGWPMENNHGTMVTMEGCSIGWTAKESSVVSLSDCISCQLALRENDPGSGDLVLARQSSQLLKLLATEQHDLISKLSCLLMTLLLEFEWHGNFHCHVFFAGGPTPHLLHVEIWFVSVLINPHTLVDWINIIIRT